MKQAPLKRKTPLKAKAPMKRAGQGKTARPKASKPKQTAIRRSARGQQCQVRVPGVCNHKPETTVLAHMNGAGMGAKAADHEAAYACSACHEWLDGGYVQQGCSRADRDLAHLFGVIRTQRILIDMGLIEVAA